MKEIIAYMEALEQNYENLAVSLREDDPENSFTSYKLAQACRKAAEELKRSVPAEAEYEGDARSSWWYVCPECHGGVIRDQRFCQNCGQKLQWSELKINNKEGSDKDGERDTGFGGYGDRDL